MTAPVTGSLRWLVLDEADRLLDLGFEAKLREIIGLLDARAQEEQGPVGGSRSKWLTDWLTYLVPCANDPSQLTSCIGPVPNGTRRACPHAVAVC
jgi:hypothetical protein